MVDCASPVREALLTLCMVPKLRRDNAAFLYATECIQLNGDELFDFTMAWVATTTAKRLVIGSSSSGRVQLVDRVFMRKINLLMSPTFQPFQP